jgi:hypothetical protein
MSPPRPAGEIGHEIERRQGVQPEHGRRIAKCGDLQPCRDRQDHAADGDHDPRGTPQQASAPAARGSSVSGTQGQPENSEPKHGGVKRQHPGYAGRVIRPGNRHRQQRLQAGQKHHRPIQRPLQSLPDAWTGILLP